MPKYPLDSVGLEYESESIFPNQAQNALDRTIWQTEHDASIESHANVLGNLVLGGNIPEAFNGAVNRVTIGTEIILRYPLSLEDPEYVKNKVYELTYKLQALGEKPENFRSGIHIHISMPQSLQILKNIVRLGMHLEDLFFYLGGQGYTFRGMIANKSAYCRPITHDGPQCVKTTNSGRVAQVFDCNDLLKVTNSAMFWNRMCNLNPMGDVPRYHPSRYCWLNWYSLLAHGSLEFRIFNTTLNPWFIFSEIMFCKSFCDTVMNMSFNHDLKREFVPNSVYSRRSRKDILNTLENYASIVELPGKILRTVADIVERTPEVIIPPGMIKTHLQNSGTYNFSGLGVKYYDEDSVPEVQVDDIHHRR